MWLTLVQGVLSRPWIIAMVAMTIFMGVQWTQINSLKGDVVELEGKVARIEADYTTCANNEKDLIQRVEVFREGEKRLNNTITGLQQQVIDEQANGVKWERKYKDRPVITKVKEVPVIEYVEKGVVVDEETSKEYVRYFNTLFAD